VPIEMWEYPVLLLLVVAIYFSGIAIQRRKMREFPEYRYYTKGLMIKVLGGIVFASIYIFYYGQGDTTSYYESAMAMCNLMKHNFFDFLTVYFGDGTEELMSYFTPKTGAPLFYIFTESSTRFTMKLLVPFILLANNSYFIATVLVSVFTYRGLWQLFRMFVSYFPQHTQRIAIAVLFMPSVIFWGSGILKDSFTLAATCYLVVTINALMFRKGNFLMNILRLLLFGFVIISIKPYILLILLPSALVWVFYRRISKIKNSLVRNLIVPFVYVLILTGSYFGLNAFGESLGKFSVSKALDTASINQKDLKQDYYQGNSFDIGDFEPTVFGALSKFPQATMAGLFRPYLWDSKNVVMLFSGLENLFVIGFTILIFIKLKWRKMRTFLMSQPLLLYCLVFSVLFAFMIGLTSPNFGALVRFRTPLIPFYMACLMIIYGELKTPKRGHALTR
jgi:hypothetical protein